MEGVSRHWVPGAAGERLKRCSQCKRGARVLTWLKSADGLPLTMPLCADCLQTAERRLTDDASENMHQL
jgi:hypothetical protein